MSWKALDWVTETDCLTAPLSSNANGIRYAARSWLVGSRSVPSYLRQPNHVCRGAANPTEGG